MGAVATDPGDLDPTTREALERQADADMFLERLDATLNELGWTC